MNTATIIFIFFAGMCLGTSLFLLLSWRFGFGRYLAELIGLDAQIEREVYDKIADNLEGDAVVFDQTMRKPYHFLICKDLYRELASELRQWGEGFDSEAIRDNVYKAEMSRKKEYYARQDRK